MPSERVTMEGAPRGTQPCAMPTPMGSAAADRDGDHAVRERAALAELRACGTPGRPSRERDGPAGDRICPGDDLSLIAALRVDEQKHHVMRSVVDSCECLRRRVAPGRARVARLHGTDAGAERRGERDRGAAGLDQAVRADRRRPGHTGDARTLRLLPVPRRRRPRDRDRPPGRSGRSRAPVRARRWRARRRRADACVPSADAEAAMRSQMSGVAVGTIAAHGLSVGRSASRRYRRSRATPKLEAALRRCADMDPRRLVALLALCPRARVAGGGDRERRAVRRLERPPARPLASLRSVEPGRLHRGSSPVRRPRQSAT